MRRDKEVEGLRLTIVDWNPHVDNDFSLDGEYGNDEGFIQELEFDSGKKRTYLKNSFIPIVYPSLSLTLDNKFPTVSGKTECEEFKKWFNQSLQYGVLPFYSPRLGYKMKPDIFKGEIGIYTFIPDSLKYDETDGIVLATFGLEEIGWLPEILHFVLITNNNEILFTNKSEAIIALGVKT